MQQFSLTSPFPTIFVMVTTKNNSYISPNTSALPLSWTEGRERGKNWYWIRSDIISLPWGTFLALLISRCSNQTCLSKAIFFTKLSWIPSAVDLFWFPTCMALSLSLHSSIHTLILYPSIRPSVHPFVQAHWPLRVHRAIWPLSS